MVFNIQDSFICPSHNGYTRAIEIYCKEKACFSNQSYFLAISCKLLVPFTGQDKGCISLYYIGSTTQPINLYTTSNYG